MCVCVCVCVFTTWVCCGMYVLYVGGARAGRWYELAQDKEWLEEKLQDRTRGCD